MGFVYAGNVRFLISVIQAGVLLWVIGLAGHLAAQDNKSAPKDVMFSGVVTSLTDNSLTAVRSGSKEAKTFVITAQTKFEGPKPRVDSRVTIRFVSGDDGDRAVSVIVRAPAKK